MPDSCFNCSQKLTIQLGHNWVTLSFVILVVLFGFTGRGFFSPETLNNILLTSSPPLLLAAGETLVIVTGGIDLSVGFVRGLVSVISAIIMRDLYLSGDCGWLGPGTSARASKRNPGSAFPRPTFHRHFGDVRGS